MQTTVKPGRTARKALAAGIAAAAAAGATVFAVQFSSADENPQTAQTCARTALPIPDGRPSTGVSGMSDDGSVIAYYAESFDPDGPYGIGALPLIYADGEVTEVPLTGDSPRLKDVNSSGVATGYAYIDGHGTPYLWSGGELSELPLVGEGGRANGINELGDVVGLDHDPSAGELPALWPADGSGPVLLPLPEGAINGVAHDIDDEGLIVGAVYDENGTATAYSWGPDGTGSPLPMPEGDGFSIATDINGGWVSGQLFVAGAGTQPLGARWNLAEGTVERTAIDYEVSVSADGTVAGHVPGSPRIAAYQVGDTVVELPGAIAPEDRSYGDYAHEISADGTLIAGDVYTGNDDADMAVWNAVIWTCE